MPVLSVSGAVLAMVIAALALVGWVADVEPLRAFVPGRPSMMPITALAMISSSIALLILRPCTLPPGRRLVGRAWALLVVAASGLVILEYALGRNLGIDLTIPGAAAQPGELPGRPALTSALGLHLVGVALLLLDSKRLGRMVDVLLFGVAMLALLGVASHLFDASTLYRFRGKYPMYMSLNSSTVYLLLSAAIAAARPDRGWMALLRSHALGGLIARPLVVGALLVPPLFGLLILLGERAGLYDSAVSFTLLVTSFGGAALLVVSRAALYVNEADIARRRVQEYQRLIFERSADGIYVTDENGVHIDANEGACQQTGRTREQLIGTPMREILAPEEHPRLDGLRDRVARGEVNLGEWAILRPDGTRVTVEVFSRILPDGRWIAFNRDVTARKAAEQALRVREAQLDAFFESAPAGMALLDRELRYLKINEALAELNGPSVAEHLGRRIGEVLRPIGEKLEPLFAHIRDTGEPLLNHEVTGATPRDPSVVRHWIVSYFPVHDGDGRVAFLGAVVHEVSELKRAQELLAKQAHDLRIYAEQISDLYNNAPCGYHSLGPTGEFLQVNDTEIAWLGHARSDVIGRPFVDFLTDESKREFEATFPRFREVGAMHDLKLDLVRRDGSTLPVLMNATAIKGTDGVYLLSRSTMFDYTEQQRLQDELKDALRSRDEFLSIASHDLKSPLTSLLIQIDRVGSIVERSPKVDGERRVPETIASVVMVARRQVERMQGLVDDLLDLTRIRAGKLTLARTRFDLVQAAREATSLLSPELERLGVNLTLHAAGPVTGSWDLRRIEQVVVNLVTNAIKYGRQQPIDVFVDENACDDGSRRARVRVVDRGIGIPPSQRQIVFERFERAIDTERQIKGLGLGLYIARRIIDAHGGTIGVESTPGEGSTFSFTVPILDGD